jgi:hypothetical protein
LEGVGQRGRALVDHVDGLDLVSQSERSRAQVPDSGARRRRCRPSERPRGGSLAAGRRRGGWRGGRRRRTRTGNGRRDGVDVSLQRVGAGTLGIALIDEVRHGVQQILAGCHHRQLALQLEQRGVQRRAGLSGRCAPSIRHLIFNGLLLGFQIGALAIERLRRGDVGSLPGRGLAAQ